MRKWGLHGPLTKQKAIFFVPAMTAVKTYLARNVLINLVMLGSRTQVTWFSWAVEPSEPNCKGFVALTTKPANLAKTWLFIYFNEPS